MRLVIIQGMAESELLLSTMGSKVCACVVPAPGFLALWPSQAPLKLVPALREGVQSARSFPQNLRLLQAVDWGMPSTLWDPELPALVIVSCLIRRCHRTNL